jgi:O-methyltransferase domain
MDDVTQTPPAHVGMLQMLSGSHIAGALACLAKLRVPDFIAAGPKSAEELGGLIGADPQALYRLMRATASVGVLSEGADGKFSQTPLSRVLTSDARPGLRALAIMGGTEWHARGWAELEYSVRTGKPTLQKIYGKPAFELFRENPDMAEVFNDAMTEMSMMDSPAVAGAYAFEGIHSLVDVAGGHGLLLATILERNPGMRGTLYEIPAVIEGAKNGPLRPWMDRCTLVAGDMFTSVPAGADAYIMKHIIHDWPDEVCIAILKSCRAGVNPGGKLLVVDEVILPGNDFAPGKFLDLQMLLFPGGMERTERQFRDLLAASGWHLTRIVPTAAGISIVEGSPA